jgi:hypothetical protein
VARRTCDCAMWHTVIAKGPDERLDAHPPAQGRLFTAGLRWPATQGNRMALARARITTAPPRIFRCCAGNSRVQTASAATSRSEKSSGRPNSGRHSPTPRLSGARHLDLDRPECLSVIVFGFRGDAPRHQLFLHRRPFCFVHNAVGRSGCCFFLTMPGGSLSCLHSSRFCQPVFHFFRGKRSPLTAARLPTLQIGHLNSFELPQSNLLLVKAN